MICIPALRQSKSCQYFLLLLPPLLYRVFKQVLNRDKVKFQLFLLFLGNANVFTIQSFRGKQLTLSPNFFELWNTSHAQFSFQNLLLRPVVVPFPLYSLNIIISTNERSSNFLHLAAIKHEVKRAEKLCRQQFALTFSAF